MDERGDHLAGHVAVVTGAGRGVGRAIAERLSGAGAAVGLIARGGDGIGDVAGAIESAGGSALAVAADVTDRTAVERAFAAIEAEFGPVSLLVNNAGTLEAVGPTWEVDPEAWWRDVEVHVRGTFVCSRTALSTMVPRNRGRVVNIVGMLGQRGEPYVTAYACAKAALFRLTDCLSNELSGRGVHIFCISPGPVLTAMTRRFLDSDEARRWVPGFSSLAESEWGPAEGGADLVFRIARGDADELSGRYVHVDHDFDELIATAGEIRAADRYVMRVVE